MQLPRFYLVSRRKPCWNAPGNWNFFSKPSKETVITPFSMVVTFPVPKAWCVTMEPGLYNRCRRSPPRMRGRAELRHKVVCARRITPAYAGKSPPRWTSLRRPRDHPRVCGEEAKIFRALCGPIGSPPRMRGRVIHLLSGCPWPWITPAYAGKSMIDACQNCPWGDHPRVCGEEAMTKEQFERYPGSPPRMRGRGQGQKRAGLLHRITPAYAGKRPASWRNSSA